MSPDVWERFTSNVLRWQNHGMWRFEKELREFAEREGLGWIPTEDRKLFRRWAIVLMRASTTFDYSRMRREQLDRSTIKFWIYHCDLEGPCFQEHGIFDQLALPVQHPFWDRHKPPNSWTCTCHLSGARSAEAANRRGVAATADLPSEWLSGSTVHPHFDNNAIPDLRQTVDLLRAGYFD